MRQKEAYLAGLPAPLRRACATVSAERKLFAMDAARMLRDRDSL